MALYHIYNIVNKLSFSVYTAKVTTILSVYNPFSDRVGLEEDSKKFLLPLSDTEDASETDQIKQEEEYTEIKEE